MTETPLPHARLNRLRQTHPTRSEKCGIHQQEHKHAPRAFTATVRQFALSGQALSQAVEPCHHNSYRRCTQSKGIADVAHHGLQTLPVRRWRTSQPAKSLHSHHPASKNPAQPTIGTLAYVLRISRTFTAIASPPCHHFFAAEWRYTTLQRIPIARITSTTKFHKKGSTMPINFMPRGRTAFDENTGITIGHPRMYPETKIDGAINVEYEYTIYRDEEIIGALVIQGTETTTEENGNRKYTYTLEIVKKTTIERIFKLKQRIENKDDDFVFISNMAQGMVNVFVNIEGSTFAQRNLAITTHDALVRSGVTIPDYAHASPDGVIVLAESHTPANFAKDPQP